MCSPAPLPHLRPGIALCGVHTPLRGVLVGRPPVAGGLKDERRPGAIWGRSGGEATVRITDEQEARTVTKREAERLSRRLPGRTTVLRFEDGGGRKRWCVEWTPPAVRARDGTLHEQATRVLYGGDPLAC